MERPNKKDYTKYSSQIDYMQDYNRYVSDLEKYCTEIEKALNLPVVVRQSEQLCQYDKMCVRKRIHNECPSDCKDDTRLWA